MTTRNSNSKMSINAAVQVVVADANAELPLSIGPLPANVVPSDVFIRKMRARLLRLSGDEQVVKPARAA